MVSGFWISSREFGVVGWLQSEDQRERERNDERRDPDDLPEASTDQPDDAERVKFILIGRHRWRGGVAQRQGEVVAPGHVGRSSAMASAGGAVAPRPAYRPPSARM